MNEKREQPTPSAPQYSPDGLWYWNGYDWWPTPPRPQLKPWVHSLGFLAFMVGIVLIAIIVGELFWYWLNPVVSLPFA